MERVGRYATITSKQVRRFPGLRNWVAGSYCCITELEKVSGAQNMQVTVSICSVGRGIKMVTEVPPFFLAKIDDL